MTQLHTPVVRSMTGQGHASGQNDLGNISVEVRTVNNRGFKCSLRLSDSLASLESGIETLARSLIHRGTVHMNVSWRRSAGEHASILDTDVLRRYVQQLSQVGREATELPVTIDLSGLVTLPGVIVASRQDRRQDDALWQFVKSVVAEAIDNLNEMRWSEGARMAAILSTECQEVRRRLDQIEGLAPRSVDVYRTRLQSKIQRVLDQQELEIPSSDLLREVQIFADRVDISEEISRLNSHLVMFRATLEQDNADPPEPTGRKLDFIIQEMFRETNTIGSKAADAEISTEVVEIKCGIERMRELVQNLE